jgi:hypothetical protein
MNEKKSTIAAIVIVAALAGTLSTVPLMAYADDSETDTDQEIKY